MRPTPRESNTRGGGEYIEPYVSYVEGDNSVHYGGGDTPIKTQFACSYSEDNTHFIIGYYDNGNVTVYTDSNNNVIITSRDGQYIATLDPTSVGDQQTIEGSIDFCIGNITNIEYNEIFNLNIGDNVPNFEEYKKFLWKKVEQ